VRIFIIFMGALAMKEIIERYFVIAIASSYILISIIRAEWRDIIWPFIAIVQQLEIFQLEKKLQNTNQDKH
jgi:hypothetical protein